VEHFDALTRGGNSRSWHRVGDRYCAIERVFDEHGPALVTIWRDPTPFEAAVHERDAEWDKAHTDPSGATPDERAKAPHPNTPEGRRLIRQRAAWKGWRRRKHREYQTEIRAWFDRQHGRAKARPAAARTTGRFRSSGRRCSTRRSTRAGPATDMEVAPVKW